MPRRKRISRQLTVSVSFETTRFSTRYLIEAYECLAPSRRRPLRPAPSTMARADEVGAGSDQGDEHARHPSRALRQGVG
jgi:hypothetical protein